MPDYKKKKHKRIFSAPKPKNVKSKRTEHSEARDIPMTPSGKKRSTVQHSTNMKVVKGKKRENSRRFKIFSGIAAVALVVVLLLELILPAGIIENTSNLLSVIGTGSYPLELDGTKTLNSVSHNSYYYILTNSHLCAVSSSGKELFSYPHGFEKPIIKTCDTRALVFNQGGTQCLIFTLNGLRETVDTEKPIITAAISDNGTYAIVSRSEKYTAAVSVYSKRGKMLYEWYSAQETVNNVGISPNGKKIAVSTFASGVGSYTSTLNVLNFNSATPEHTETFDNTIIYNIDTSYRNGFGVVTENTFKFIKWSKKYKATEYKNEYSTALFRACANGYVVVYNRENDKTDNKIAFISKTGALKAELGYKGIIGDIQYYSGHIYCMSDNDVQKLNLKGEILKTADCGFGAVRLSPLSADSAAIITDNKIEKIKFD